ncbi:hypothetical protein A9D46_14855 [Photobacterium damselae subsp. damselae]|uniref:hypothetical protein n=1 Tax=Photobacterium damselae TaxID=38293 RepID=UPI00084A707E|nr:hypothetical protein [Photobacterium damselae]OEC82340.1 hypothetical protein A9D46_14855 [Photobacterium damselae subsp. damselae]
MILIVSGFAEYFVNHHLRAVSVVNIGLSEQIAKMEQDEKVEATYILGEPCSQLLAERCIGNSYRVTVMNGLATVADEQK